MIKIKLFMLLKHIILTLFLFSLPPVSSIAAEETAPATSFSPLTLQLKWRHAFQFAGFYAADIKGFYKEAGLKVTMKQRLKKISSVEILLTKEVDYAVTSGSGVLMSRLQGEPVKALAVIFQHSPNILLSRKDAGIRSPADLFGKKIMFSKDPSNREFTAMLIHEGIAPKSLTLLQPSWNFRDLISGKVDVMNTYITSAPFFLRQQGVEVSFLQPINYGVDFYGDTLSTTTEEYNNNPERVKAFLQASLKGWQYAFEHPEELADYILTLPGVHKRKLSKESLLFEAQEMQKLIQPKLIELGHINPGRFKHMADTFVQQGLIQPGYSLDGFIFDPDHNPQRKWLLILLGAACGVLVIGSIAWFVTRQLSLVVREKTKKYKESEERFNNLVTMLPEMVWEADLTGKLTYVNKAALKHFGQNTTDLPTDLSCIDMLIPEDRKQATEKMKQVCLGQETGLNEYTALGFDGSQFPVWIRSAVVMKDGQAVGIRGIIIDISERRKLEEQLNQAQKMEAIGTLAGGIAHDFNNILAAVLGYTELAGMHLGDDKQVQKDLDHVRKGALRARDLVAQILAFSRKSEKKIALIEPSLIVIEALKLLRSSVPTTITIKQNIREKSKIQIDPTQFHQIIMNICTNGIQAMEQEGGCLTVTLDEKNLDPHDLHLSSDLKKGLYLCLEISDTGKGMDKAVREKIFDPYFTTKEPSKGTGLGLAVVHGIVKEYNGGLRVYTEPDKGTTFYVYLPAANTLDVPQAGNSIQQIPHSHNRGHGERIMVVDDEEELVILLSDLLSHAHYRVCTYTDSKQAWDHFSKNKDVYDLILTDMTMPGITGLELSEKCLQLCPDLPIILMTGFSEQVNKNKAQIAGIRGFIQKPLETKKLLKHIHQLIRKE